MKVLFKKVICESRKQCTRSSRQTTATEYFSKKKRKRENAKRWTLGNSSVPKQVLSSNHDLVSKETIII